MPLLFTILCGLLCLALLVSRKEIFSPTVLLLVGFLLSSVWTVVFSKMWDFKLSTKGLFLLLMGIGVFVVISLFIEEIANCLRSNKTFIGRKNEQKSKYVSDLFDYKKLENKKTPLLVFFVFEIIIFIWRLVAISAIFPGEDIFSSIAQLNHTGKFTAESTYLGFPLSPLSNLCMCGCYVIVILFAQELASEKRRNLILLIGCTGVLIMLVMSTGGRMGILRYAFVFVVAYFFFFRREHKTRKVFGFAGVMSLIGASTLFLLFFQASLEFLGRSSESDFWYYLGVYLGSQIPNFDYFVNNVGQQDHGIWGYMTFVNLINYIGDKLNIASFIYVYDQPFLYHNGHSTGNVYTMFYSFFYDFGAVGIFVLSAVMAFLVQISYQLVRSTPGKFYYLVVICYGIIAYTVFLSFFCDRFYEDVTTISFVRNLVYIIISKVLLCDLYSAAFVRLRISSKNVCSDSICLVSKSS